MKHDKSSRKKHLISFQANPNDIGPGQPSILSWTTLGATYCTIDQLAETLCSPAGAPPPYLSPPDDDRLAPNGQVKVCPMFTTTYILTAYDEGGGEIPRPFTVNVEGAQVKFWDNPFEPIDCTDPQVELHWEVQDAGQLILSWDPGNLDGTDVTRKSSYIVTPTVDTTYTLHVGGSPPAIPPPITVTVLPAAITTFTAEAASFIRGQPVTLAWATEHACSCVVDQDVGTLTPAGSGSMQIYPQAQTTYTLTANGLGESVTQEATATPQASGWAQTTAMGPTALTGFSYRGQLWMIDTKNGIVWSSTDGVNWIPVTYSLPLSNDLLNCAAAVFDEGHGEKMWVMGGADTNDQMLNTIWNSVDGVTWTEVQAENIWPARAGHACLAFQNKLWVMGGYTNTGLLNDVWSSPDGVYWTQVTAIS